MMVEDVMSVVYLFSGLLLTTVSVIGFMWETPKTSTVFWRSIYIITYFTGILYLIRFTFYS